MTDKPQVEHKKITDFTPDGFNANKGTERGLRMLDDSLSSVGAGRSIVVDKHGRIIAGNKTTERAVDNGFEDAIVVHTTGDKLVVVQRDDLDLYADDPENRARMLAYYDNRVAQLDLDWNAEQLLADNQLGVPLDKFFSGDELLGMGIASEADVPEDAGAQVDRADELQAVWQVNKGDLWVIPSITGNGSHRLLCGDSTNADDVATVMSGDKADAVITDPPYGIGVDKSMHEKSGQQYGNAAAPKRYYPDTNWDSATPDKNTLDTIRFFATEVIIWGGNYFDLPPTRCYLVWDKQNGANQFADCELAWTNIDKPVRIVHHLWNGMLREGGEDRLPHPTQKPLEVITWAIQQFMKNPLLIYDPFGGSGTTMVACEQLSRQCRMIEIEPKYCSVILQRMQDLGCTPVKAD